MFDHVDRESADDPKQTITQIINQWVKNISFKKSTDRTSVGRIYRIDFFNFLYNFSQIIVLVHLELNARNLFNDILWIPSYSSFNFTPVSHPSVTTLAGRNNESSSFKPS